MIKPFAEVDWQSKSVEELLANPPPPAPATSTPYAWMEVSVDGLLWSAEVFVNTGEGRTENNIDQWNVSIAFKPDAFQVWKLKSPDLRSQGTLNKCNSQARVYQACVQTD